MAYDPYKIIKQQQVLAKKHTGLYVMQPTRRQVAVIVQGEEKVYRPLILGGRRYWWRGRRGRITSEELAWWKTLGNLGKSIRAWTTASKNELVTFTRNNYGIDISSFPDFAQRAFGHLLTGAKPTKAEYKALRREYRRSEYGRRGERVSTVEGKQLRSILSMYAKEFKPRSKTWGGGSGGDVDANTGKPLRPAQIRKTTTDGTIDTTGWTKQDLYNYARVHGAETTDVKSIYEKNYQQWKTADVVKPLTLLPEFSAQAGEFTVIAGEAIKNIATGKIIGYIGPGNSLMDLHGTVIGSYEGDRKDADKVYLAEFKAVPKREGIPYCTEKNYEKAKKYLVELMEKGVIPGGSVLVQRHGEWVYIPPRPENETFRLDTGEWVFKQSYDELDKDAQDYLNKYGIKQYIASYAPAQEWVAEASTKKALAPFGTTYKTPGEAYKAGVITLKELSAYKSAELYPAKGKEVYAPVTTYDLAAAREGGISDSFLIDKAGFSEADIKDAKEWQAKLKSGEIIALPDGTYMPKNDFDKQPEGCQEILKAEGFSGYFAAVAKYSSIEEAKDIVEARLKAKWLEDNPYPGFLKSHGVLERDWGAGDYDLYLDILKARDAVLRAMSPSDAALYYKGGAVYLQGLALSPLTMIFPPSKALKKEYTIGDVSKVEWALGAVNIALIGAAFAPGAVVGSLAGRGIVTGIATTGAGLVGYETAKHWTKLTPLQQGLGVGATLLYALPLLGSAARGIKITSGKIPTVVGDVTTWKGLTIARNPVIGMSQGKFVVGARNITLPEARLILNGYHPLSVLETKVFVNTKALKAAGFADDQIDFLIKTLKSRNLFAGKQSPFLAKEALVEPTARLDADEVNVFLKKISEHSKAVDQVDLLYGSPTIKAQLTPELRGWRQIHDWDIGLNVGLAKTEAFARELLKALQKLPGNRQYRINPKNPLLVEKKIGGKWEHIADIHSSEVKPDVSEIPGSKLDTTGEYSYGRLVAEPAITVKYPGAVKISIMRLSESGVRKADTILRVRQTPQGTAFRPPKRGIAHPGVPKDAADFYVILRTLKGQKVADEWAASWTKAMGYPSSEISKILPRIIKAMEEVAAKTPSDMIGYRLTPSKVPTGGSPTITIHVPSSLVASVSGSLKKLISAPISPYALSASAALSLSPSQLASISGGKVSPSIASPKISPSPKASPSMSVAPSISASPSPSGSPSPRPTPSPSPYPSPTPVPTPTPGPAPIGKKPPPIPPKVAISKLTKAQREGLIAYKMGWCYKVFFPPYGQDDIIHSKKPMQGVKYFSGPGSAMKSIIARHGPVPPEVRRDMGMMHVIIRTPWEKTSKPRIYFRRKHKKASTTPGITGVR